MDKIIRAKLLIVLLTAAAMCGDAIADGKKIILSENLSITEIEKDVLVINHNFELLDKVNQQFKK